MAAMLDVLATAPDLRVDYVAIVEPTTFAPVTHIEKPSLAAVAAFVGSTRLIDNQMLTPTDST
jgi:pantoate--beta-alanine ligase